MKHGIAFRKFSRTSSHRDLMLRNLVTSLFEHEQIKTTLPKARDTARLAEKIITMGKKGTRPAFDRASAFLLKPSALVNLFEKYAPRYAERAGGYTRILKSGNRQGDNAPVAILELVDNPRDLKHEMTARAIGFELVKSRLQRTSNLENIGTTQMLEKEAQLAFGQEGKLRPKTRWNLQKTLKFRGPQAVKDLSQKVTEYSTQLLATPVLARATWEAKVEKNQYYKDPAPRPGQQYPGDTRSALQLAKGKLGRQVAPPANPMLTVDLYKKAWKKTSGPKPSSASA
ncbi:ribosomal protein L17 [Schizophyllum amplum]|uniref:Ribosomal protein L17 n=1 Tax=Schizophyllum amplum TaxID=97359 RepID=A0A550CN39_9AGAR|nr:ribosomal protein L17 [Auriculariopsis ampla]